MGSPRILVGGVGNVFLGDDGFGVEVAERLRARVWPAGVDVVDFGIRGIDLAYALSDYDAAILIDAMARGGAPGTLYVLEPELGGGSAAFAELHAMTPDRVLGTIDSAYAPRTVRVVGCEPASFGSEGVGQEGLSPAVLKAVAEAVQIVASLVDELIEGSLRRA